MQDKDRQLGNDQILPTDSKDNEQLVANEHLWRIARCEMSLREKVVYNREGRNRRRGISEEEIFRKRELLDEDALGGKELDAT